MNGILLWNMDVTCIDVGDKLMSRPIKLGLVLEGEDAARFEKYLSDPGDITPEGKKLLIEAARLARKRRI